MIPWTVQYAAAQVKMHGYKSVPSWLLLAVQMHYNEGGCASCAHPSARV